MNIVQGMFSATEGRTRPLWVMGFFGKYSDLCPLLLFSDPPFGRLEAFRPKSASAMC